MCIIYGKGCFLGGDGLELVCALNRRGNMYEFLTFLGREFGMFV